eukprot:PITA_28890
MVGIVLTGKENHPEWSRMIKHTLIFNELWKGVCIGDGDKEPEQPNLDKELVIWENEKRKAYALITASVNEEVSHHISPLSTAFEAFQKLKELYDSHCTLEVVKLMIKVFTLELQNNDPLALASEVKSIMHDIKSTKVELDIPLIAFLKVLYPTYSNYLDSLQANGNLKDITFNSLVKNFVEREKAFGKKTTPESYEEVVCLVHKENNLSQDSSRGRGGRRGRGRYFKGRGGRRSQGEKADLHCIRCKRNGSHDASTCKLPWDKIEKQRNQQKGKTNDIEKGKAPESTHYVVAQYQSKINPSGLGTIRLKLLGLPDFLLHHVLYLPQLKRNLLSLVHIHLQHHSIHIFHGKLEVRKASNHSLVMRGIEEERLLKLQATSARAQHFSYNSHYEEGTLPSSLLWHARFGHSNYDSLCLLKKNGVAGLPTIPRKFKHCDAYILGKHSKQYFHDSNSRAHRKLELIHSDLCGPMSVPSTNGNKYMMTFINDYTIMCWVYLLKNKSDAFQTFKNLHKCIGNDAQCHIGYIRNDNGK